MPSTPQAIPGCRTNIVLIGSMGAGKSTLGRLLARAFKRPFYDSDEVIEARCGASIPWIFDLEGEAGFRQREAQIIQELAQQQGIVLATGGGAILCPENRRCLRQTGIVVFLRTTVDQQLERLSGLGSHNRPLLKTPNPRQRLEALWKARQPLYEETAHLILDTDERPPKEMLLALRNQLADYLENPYKP